MKIFQVYLIGKEFVGQSKQNYDDPKVYLRNAVTVSRTTVSAALSVGVAGGRQLQTQRTMSPLAGDPDYVSSTICIHTGPNVLVLELNPEGTMAKHYLETIEPNKEKLN